MQQNPYFTNDTKSNGPPNYTPYNNNNNNNNNEMFTFLQSIGLECFYGKFTDAQVYDMDTLKRLNQDDLKEIGLPVGPRRKLLDEVHPQFNQNQNNQQNVNNFVNNVLSNINDTYSVDTPPPEQPSTANMSYPPQNNNNNNYNHSSSIFTTSTTFQQYQQPQQHFRSDQHRQPADPHGVMDKTSRPWLYCIFGTVFALPFPFFCFGLIFHFCGHTRHYVFNNEERVLSFDQFRGMCCTCLDQDEAQVEYSNIRCIEVEVDHSVRINDQPSGLIKVQTHDGRTYTLSAAKDTTIWMLRDQAKQISEFTGIPLQQGLGGAIMF